MSWSKKSYCFALASLFIGSLPVIAAEQVFSVRDLPDRINNIQKGRLSISDITIHGVQIGRETLADVKSRFGATTSFRTGLPGNASSDIEICYVISKNSKKPTWIIFGSGAMGAWETVVYFQVHSAAPKGITCAESSLGGESIATDSGVRLGMSLNELTRRIGQPTESKNGFVVFAFEQKSDHPDRPHYDMSSALRATIVGGRLSSFEVSLVESY